jgi:predicted 3-demethylubiquinone-9 3-methyltransferase (glyoxalase superfamily)
MPAAVRPFLMFEGRAEEAMNFYVSLFDDGRVLDIVRYDAAGPGAEGSVVKASFTVAGQTILCIDSPAKHQFTFTPAVSLFVDCESRAQQDGLIAALAEGGAFLMPPGNYGFSQHFAWLNDRFGVSWQINLP